MKYKKGDLVELVYRINDDRFCSVGIVLDISDELLKIGHNFKKTNPVDITNVPVGGIIDIKTSTPKEVSIMNDIS